MDEIVIYHNPRCSKSRGALELLRERGVEPRVVPYLDEPLDRATLERLLALLGMGARELLRSGEDAYRELGLADPAIDDARLIEAMLAQPRLIERPIVVRGDRAVVARPPERVLELL